MNEPYVNVDYSTLCADPDFKEGDLVRLNSGGPEMTVHIVDGEWIDVRWFDGHKLGEARLNRKVLQLVVRAGALCCRILEPGAGQFPRRAD